MIVFSCRRAAELISKELDTPLPTFERLGSLGHRFLCADCRRYRHQLVEIDRALGEYLLANGGGPGMPEQSKIRISASLRIAFETGDPDSI